MIVALRTAARGLGGSPRAPAEGGGARTREPSVPRVHLWRNGVQGIGWPPPPWGFLRALQRPQVLSPRTRAWVPGAVRPQGVEGPSSEASLPSSLWEVESTPQLIPQNPSECPQTITPAVTPTPQHICK